MARQDLSGPNGQGEAPHDTWAPPPRVAPPVPRGPARALPPAAPCAQSPSAAPPERLDGSAGTAPTPEPMLGMRMMRERPARSGVVAPTFGVGAQARRFIPSRAGDLGRQGSKRGAAIRLGSAAMTVEWRTAEQRESSH
jgi:hypothetical protein